jgi:hypothetical protein
MAQRLCHIEPLEPLKQLVQMTEITEGWVTSICYILVTLNAPLPRLLDFINVYSYEIWLNMAFHGESHPLRAWRSFHYTVPH